MAEATTPPPPSDRAVTGKCEQTTPMGQTPQRPKKRVPLREKDHTIGYVSSASTCLPLFLPATPGNWSAEEVKALVEFVLFHGNPVHKWLTHKQDDFWASAARFMQTWVMLHSVELVRTTATNAFYCIKIPC